MSGSWNKGGFGTWCLLLLLLAVLAACSESGGGASPTCAVPQVACAGACVDSGNDPNHCGGCGLVCPGGTTCVTGSCRASDGAVLPAVQTGAVTCAAGQLDCGGCVDPTSSDAHCGGCNLTCLSGQVCDQGACRPIAEGCPAGRSLCDGACHDLTTSALHCGSCNTQCGGGTCAGGVCACPTGTTSCASGCVDTLQSVAHCGGCDLACAPGQACSAGTCVCPMGETLCDGGCTNLLVDALHCGSCTTSCGLDQSCVGGACLCPEGLSPCESGCQDLAISPTDCGSCGVACAGGQTCVGGSCACPTDQTLCGDVCTNLLQDNAHCGGCDSPCTGGQLCSSGACQCPEGQTLCDEACSDTQTSTDHCGGCGNACATGQLCNLGTCECPEGQALCGEACIDILANDANCGGCDVVCMGGQTCQAGSCECPMGQSLCDGLCIESASDPLNCGGCGIACGLGELCNESQCQGGGLGDDGCAGIAQNLELTKLSLYQTIEIPVMDQGAEVEDRIVDVVAGRETLVRLFVDVGPDWASRSLSARLFLDDGTERVTLYTAAPQTVSGPSTDMDRESTFEFMVEGGRVTPTTRYAVEVVECGTEPEPALSSPRFPAQDGVDLGAVLAGGLRIHIIPLRANGMLPDTSTEGLEPYRAAFLATYPIDGLEFTVAEPYDIANADDWVTNLDDLRGLRENDSPDPAVYYYGMLRPTENIRDFCGGGCTAGIGYVPNGNGGFAASGRVSLGLAYDDSGSSIQTMLHEVGHNHGRNHAPCVPPGSSIAGVDPDYPYDNANIGVIGYSIVSDALVPDDAPDIMAYCDGPWFSDYTYRGLMDTVRAVNQTQQSVIVDPARVGHFRVLLLESGKAPRWARPRSGVVAAEGAAEAAFILDQHGSVVEVIDVYRLEIADVHAFSIDVPEQQPGWHALRLKGGEQIPF